MNRPTDSTSPPSAAGDDPAPAAYDPQRFADAIRYGQEARRRLGPGAQWTDAEASLADGWPLKRAGSTLSWEEARPAVFDAWQGRI